MIDGEVGGIRPSGHAQAGADGALAWRKQRAHDQNEQVPPSRPGEMRAESLQPQDENLGDGIAAHGGADWMVFHPMLQILRRTPHNMGCLRRTDSPYADGWSPRLLKAGRPRDKRSTPLPPMQRPHRFAQSQAKSLTQKSPGPCRARLRPPERAHGAGDPHHRPRPGDGEDRPCQHRLQYAPHGLARPNRPNLTGPSAATPARQAANLQPPIKRPVPPNRPRQCVVPHTQAAKSDSWRCPAYLK